MGEGELDEGSQKAQTSIYKINKCDHLEGWASEGGRETQEGGDMGIYVYL